MPILKPALATIGLFCTFTYRNDWWLSLLYIDAPKLTSLQYYLYRIGNGKKQVWQRRRAPLALQLPAVLDDGRH
ncbi:MAG: hypothetical protein LBP74_01885 [Treponema sp.]|jgi:ABC-type glycerol-3-phosphate transport system permease component|nr:hypothetical protein [Treponema sp.]